MWIFYLAGTVIIFGLLFYNFQQSKKKNIKYIYSELIALCQHIDKNIRLEHESADSLTFEISNHRGSLLLVLTQFDGILCVEIERINSENIIDNQEWYFLENENQKKMFHQMVSDIIATKSGVLKEITLLKLEGISSDFVNDPKNHLGVKNKRAQILFCKAYDGVKKFPRYKYANSEGRFEMLLFNCVLLISKTPVGIKQQEQTTEIISLLLFYLEKHQIINHIKDIDLFFESRFTAYQQQFLENRDRTDQEWRQLFYLFFIKPLNRKEKVKYKEIEDVHFKNAVTTMIKNLESDYNLIL